MGREAVPNFSSRKTTHNNVFHIGRPICYTVSMPTVSVAFGRVLRKHRQKKRWSQMELAAKAGLHINEIGNLERGTRSPTLQTVFLLCDALKVEPDRFVALVDFYRT